MIRKAVVVGLTRVDATLHGRGFRIALAVGTVLVALTWALSYSWGLDFRSKSERFSWFVVQGSFYVNTYPKGYGSRPNVRGWRWNPGFSVGRASLFTPLYFYWPEVTRSEDGFSQVKLPLYIPFAGFVGVLIYPSIPFVRRRWRRRRGQCVRCAYDLTGNTSGVCPECGTPIATEPRAGDVQDA